MAILAAVELAGVLGAFLAIPVAGMFQVIARDLWNHRRARRKEQPTVGEEETPVDDVLAEPSAVGAATRPREA